MIDSFDLDPRSKSIMIGRDEEISFKDKNVGNSMINNK